MIPLLLIIFFTLGAVGAAENTTDDAAPLETVQTAPDEDCLSEDFEPALNATAQQKQDHDTYIDFRDEVPKHSGASDFFYITFGNVPQEMIDSNVDVKIDDAPYGSTHLWDRLEIIPSTYSIGNHTITVNIPESEHYIAKTLTKDFEVCDIAINIPKKIISGQNDYIEMFYPKDATGTVTVKINGAETFKKSLTDYEWNDGYPINIPLNNLQSDKQATIEVTYTGNYPAKTKRTTANVIGYRLDVDVAGFDVNYMGHDSYLVKYGDEGTFIEVVPPYNGKSTPSVTVNGKRYDVKLYSTEYNIYRADISNLDIGTYIATVSYADDNYPLVEHRINLDVRPIITSPYNYLKGHNEFQLTLPENATGNLKVYISNEWYINSTNESQLFKSVPVINGYAAIPIGDLVNGKHYWYACYDGDDYNVTAKSDCLDLNVCTVLPEICYCGENKYLEIYSYNTDNRILMLKIGDTDYIPYDRAGERKYNVQMTNGVGKLSLSQFKEGVHYYEICYNNTPLKYYETFYIEKHNYRINGAADVNMYYSESKSYTLQILEDGHPLKAGEIVNVKIGKQTIKAKTDKNGKIKVNINQLPGKYTITATYKDVKKTNKLTVKSVLSLKAVKIKKSAKKLILQATLKKAKTPIKNKKITFKFAGKTYKTKTNKKGIAKITIKKSVLKKLKVGKKVAYQATYLKCTVKKTAKVKK